MSPCRDACTPRGRVLVMGVLMALVSGTHYAFGGFERAIKERLRLSQTDIQNIGIVFDSADYLGHPLCGWFAGEALNPLTSWP